MRRAINRFPAVRRLVKSALGQYLIQTVRGARAVRETIRFAALQAGRRRVGRYHLRDSGLAMFVRHRTRDIEILNEIFGGTGGRRSYEPPAEYQRLLDALSAPRILDLGGNIGLFGVYAFSRWPAARITSFEPDPENARMLSETIAANELEEQWSLEQTAVGVRAGAVDFVAGLLADSGLADAERAAESGQVISVPSVDVFARNDRYDVVKMDIEGGEWPILSDQRLANLDAALLVLEWHRRGCPEPDPRGYALRLLRSAGFGDVREVAASGSDGLLWARRTADSSLVPASVSP